ncbi:class I SAM-dependent methyltransferase [Candidatus Azambacteria bacterium]|nr:class I SAM-dependent methyltransferase [Candidatus Azambacteria bacterium]
MSFPPLKSAARFLNPSDVLAQVGFAPGMRVADFGCGAGDWALITSRLVGADGQVCAIDVQDAALS